MKWHKSRCIIFLALIVWGCENQYEKKKPYQEVKYIERLHNENLWLPPSPQKKELPSYVWEVESTAPFPVITKDYFCCRGSTMNPPRFIQRRNEQVRIEDCGGLSSHSLPLKNGKEFIYPVLIDLMNYLQESTHHKVVITAGHRCPKHHQYARAEDQSLTSKHMIGAEVAFYVQGMEYEPEKIISILKSYYQSPKYSKEYTEFQRYTKDDTDVETLPWYNSEIYIKLYKADEGRDFDNRHPYPYIRVQVRYDREEDKKVRFNWDLAEKNYLRL